MGQAVQARRRHRHVRRGDWVRVIAGKHKGATGKVIKILTHCEPNKEFVQIEGVALQQRHLKPNRHPKHPQGGVLEKTGLLHISNVLPIDPESKERRHTRVGFLVKEDGSKVRIAKRSGAELSTLRKGTQKDE
jgi:large subunit ribosomal protein L24